MPEGLTKLDLQDFSVTPLAGSLGAEVRGLDVSAVTDLSPELNGLFLSHKVLTIRGQALKPAALLAFSKLWGDVHFYPYMTGLPEEPQVFEIVTSPDAKRVFGNRWHSDQMYDAHPCKATLLFAHDLPPVGGDTIFTDLEAAYDALSNGMKAMLAGLRIHCDPADKTRYGGKTRAEWYAGDDMSEKLNGKDQSPPVGIHPLIRTHPETGRKCLFVGDQVQRFEGLSLEESAPLLAYLMAHIQRPEFTCRVRWEPGTLVMWDNRCTCHYAVADYVGEFRRMHRVTISGDTPY